MLGALSLTARRLSLQWELVGAVYGETATYAQQVLNVPGNWSGRTFKPCGKNWSSAPGRESCTGFEESYRPEGGRDNSLMNPVGGHCCDGPPGLGTLLYYGMPEVSGAKTDDLTAMDPRTDPEALVDTPWGARVSVLGDGLFRVQLNGESSFDERPTFQVVNRMMPVPGYNVTHEDASMTVASQGAAVSIQPQRQHSQQECAARGSCSTRGCEAPGRSWVAHAGVADNVSQRTRLHPGEVASTTQGCFCMFK